MADTMTLEPDVGFIREVGKLGGGDLKKCYQCATCSVACPISPDNKPFPRKEMIAASWGLKDRLIADYDVWLCHNCGDCTTLCPRGAKPGEVLGALRAYAVREYATPKALAKAVANPKMLPILFAVPAVIFIVMGMIFNSLGINWFNISPDTGEIWQSHFINNYLVDIIMIPTFFGAIGVFALGLKKFLNDMHQQAIKAGKAEDKPLNMGGVVAALVRTVVTILTHRKFNECGENKGRATAHMLVLFSFIGLFIVTNCFFFAEWVLHIEGPYSQLNPVKWLGNIAGVALVVGSILLWRTRLANKDQGSSYWDWYLVVLAFALGVTGLGTEIARLMGFSGITYFIYFLHLMFIWSLFAYTPFSKLAHLVYRTTAMTYAEYTNRK
jgi:quinone-modifying oxidoreductase subunit QmoC